MSSPPPFWEMTGVGLLMILPLLAVVGLLEMWRDGTLLAFVASFLSVALASVAWRVTR